MENKKSLIIDTAFCDVRKVTEEFLSTYASVEINAATVVTSQSAQVLLGKYGVEIDCAHLLTLEDNVQFTTLHGTYFISPSTTVPEEKTYLMLNGCLEIEPGSETALEGYTAITVHGTVNCPRSIADRLGSKLTVSGAFNTYPDGCIRLKKNTVLDRFFHLRAKQDAVYYVPRCVIALSPDINFAKLAEKNVRFETKKLLVTESLAETAVPFFGETVDISVFPDGCAYVDGDAVLDEALLKRYGGRLYVTGDLTVPAKSAALLDRVTYLRIDGDLLVSRGLKDRVLAMDVEYGRFYTVGSTLIANAGSQQIDAYVLEHAEDGVSAISCAHISIAPDVSPELLREKLVSIIACASISCASKEQISALSMLEMHDVASVSLEGQENGAGDEDEDENTVRINTAQYTF